MNRTFFKIYIFAALFLLLSLSSFSDEKLKFAESFEKNGDFKNSARIYLELFNSNPKNNDYFNGLVRSYKALNQFTELMPFIEKRISLVKNPESLGIYGEINWRLGKTQEANKAWEDGIKSNPNDKNTYEIIAKYQIAVKQFDKAISTYKTGRDKFNSAMLFSDDMSQLYIAVGNAEEGLKEILNSFDVTRNTPVTEGRLSALKQLKGADIMIDSELNSRYSNTDHPEGYRLLIWHLRTVDKQEKALELSIKLDQLQRSNGMELNNFARISQNDGNYDIALKAYELVLRLGEKSPYFHNALYGIARTIEQKMELEKKFDPKSLNEIIDKYRDIVKKYPNSSSSYDCQFRIGLINFNYLKNYKSAKEEFEMLSKVPGGNQSVALAGIYLGKIEIINNNFSGAISILENTIRRFGPSFPAVMDEAKLNVADLYFYRGEIDTAQKLYEECSTNSKSNISNNALEMIILIENNKTQNLAIRQFASAMLMERQNNLDSAITLFTTVLKSGGGSELEERAYIKLGNIYKEKSDFTKAIENYNLLKTKIPESIFADQALFSIGKVHLAANNKKEAENTFKELLSAYPRSLFLPEARQIIRKLRAGS
jgi:tetratricopeptide (TPR) repeat protein